ncbi:hypothetical protein Tco_1183555 [Tanacetum coccineum]
MVVRTFDVKKDPFRPRDVDEEILGPEVPYLRAIRALMFLAENEAPTALYEDNAACIAEPKEVRSSDNLADLFTKALPTSTFKKLSHNIGMRQLKDLK